MKLFSKTKKENYALERVSIFDTDYPINKGNWFQVKSACLGKIMAIQSACGEQVVNVDNWSASLKDGYISFGGTKYPLQFLGNESNQSNTWQWGYENVNRLDENLLKLAYEARETGKKWGLEPLATPRFELDDSFNGHNLSIVACGISKDKYCYYGAPHRNGVAFLAFSGVPESVFDPVDIFGFAKTAGECLQQFSIDHKIFIESFLMWNGTDYEWYGNDIVAHFAQDLLISFEQADEFWRVTGLESI